MVADVHRIFVFMHEWKVDKKSRFYYVNENKSFLTEETAGYIMSGENSVDIDTEMDFAYCEWLINRR